MWRELDVAGVYLPPLLAYLVAAFLLYVPLRFALGAAGFWRWTWNQPLAEAGTYVCLLALLSSFL